MDQNWSTRPYIGIFVLASIRPLLVNFNDITRTMSIDWAWEYGAYFVFSCGSLSANKRCHWPPCMRLMVCPSLTLPLFLKIVSWYLTIFKSTQNPSRSFNHTAIYHVATIRPRDWLTQHGSNWIPQTVQEIKGTPARTAPYFLLFHKIFNILIPEELPSYLALFSWHTRLRSSNLDRLCFIPSILSRGSSNYLLKKILLLPKPSIVEFFISRYQRNFMPY